MIDPSTLRTMRRDWDARARENAKHYVATSRENWNSDEFLREGAEQVHELVEKHFAEICNGRAPSDMRVLEIGCGIGRMTMALSRIFGAVDAVDISPEMIAQARIILAGRPNVQLHVNNGADLSMFADSSFDFAISIIVFQHIPKRAIVENYIKETWRVLRPASLFKFQVQGAPEVEADPDHSWVGVSFTERAALEMAERCGFEMRHQYGAGDQYYWLWFFNRAGGR